MIFPTPNPPQSSMCWSFDAVTCECWSLCWDHSLHDEFVEIHVVGEEGSSLVSLCDLQNIVVLN